MEKECVHIFIGDENGVKCKLCGKRLTFDQYQAFLKPAPVKKTTVTKKTVEE